MFDKQLYDKQQMFKNKMNLQIRENILFFTF